MSFKMNVLGGDAWPTKTLNWVRPIFSDSSPSLLERSRADFLGNVRLVRFGFARLSFVVCHFGFARLSFVRSAESPTICASFSKVQQNPQRYRWGIFQRIYFIENYDACFIVSIKIEKPNDVKFLAD